VDGERKGGVANTGELFVRVVYGRDPENIRRSMLPSDSNKVVSKGCTKYE
jgi:hypothetical protein